MLQKLREKTTGWIAIVILGLLIIPFAFFGLENYFTVDAATYVAKVGDEEISQDQFRQRFEQYRAQMRRMMGENFDNLQFEDPAVKRRFLDQLVEEKVLEQAARARGIVIPAAQLQKEIADIPAFQVNGQFDPTRYQMMLAGQRMTPAGFQEQMRRDLQVQMLPAQIVETGFVSEAYLDSYLALRDQRRSFRYAVLPAPAEATGAVDEAALQAYYDANTAQFMREELVTIEYLLVTPDALDAPVTVDEQTLRTRFEEQRARFTEQEARLAAHVLVAVPPSADADTVKAAQERAAAVAGAARKEGTDFSALVAEHSDDAGSKAAGGELGWIERGELSPAFEDALFALEPGAVSDPVKTEDGWHVIQLREVRAEKASGFDEVRADLEREYLEGERERAFSDVSGRLVDLVYRDPTTLQTASEELDLEIRRAGPFSRAGGEGIAADPAVVEAAFSDDVLVGGSVSDPVELASGGIAVVRVDVHEPARPLPFAEVRDRVQQAVLAEGRSEAARARADEALAAVQSGTPLADIATTHGASVETVEEIGRNAPSVEAELVNKAFALPQPSAPGAVSTGRADLGGDRYALIELTAVADGDASALDPAARTALREQLGRAVAGVEARGFLDALRAQAEVVIVEERL